MTRTRTGMRLAFAIAEFRAVWAAEAISLLGDQLARVALAVLVYARTSSTLLTALTYALTFVPTLIGGALFGALADRYERRTVMISCDLIRALLVAVMALPGVPLGALMGLLAMMIGLGGPARAALLASLPEMLPNDEQYTAGLAARSVTGQAAQLVGFAGGGAVIPLMGARGGLAADAATFAVSAVFVALGMRRRAPAAADTARRSTLYQAWHGISTCIGDRGLRSLTGLACLAGFYVAPEGLAAPYAATFGHSSVATGLLMAADPAGSVLGAVLASRLPKRWRLQGIGSIAIASGIPLLICFAHPALVLAIVAFALVGVVSTMYLVPLGVALGRGAPTDRRGQIMGLYGTCLIAAQGIGSVLAGGIATSTDPAVAIAVCGLLCMLTGLPLARSWSRAAHREPARWAAA